MLLEALLAEAKICQFNMALTINKNIFWLQVSVHDTLGVKVLQRKDNLGCVEPGAVLVELAIIV